MIKQQISNDFITALVIVALVISLTSTVGVFLKLAPLEITGAQGSQYDTATASFQISELVEINWSQDTLDWGSGNVDSGPAADLNSNDTACNLTGDETVENGTWGCEWGDLMLENLGTQNVNFTLSCDKYNQTMIGGTAPNFQIFWFEINNSCYGDINDNYTSWGEVIPDLNLSMCTGFNFTDTDNEMRMEVLLHVPNDAPGTGSPVSATFVASATAL